MTDDGIERLVKIITAVVAVLVFLAGVLQFISTQRIEASKPFLQKKLERCEQAIDTAATIALAEGNVDTDTVNRFWRLYWGLMGLVEKKDVERAMVDFGNALKNQSERGTLRERSLAIAHACREEMARDW